MQAYNSLAFSFSGPGRTRKGAALTVSAHFLKTAVLLVILGLCMNADAQETALDLILKGDEQYAAGAYLAALSLYDKALRIEPTNATAWSNRGACLLDLGRHNEALASLEKALTIDHRCSTYRLKSFALRKLGRVSEAEACDAKAVQIENELKEAATEAYLSGLYDDAITKLNVLLRNEVRDATVWNLAGVSTVGKGRHLEALKYYDYALEYSPRDDVILVNKAKCLLTLDRCGDALAALKVATTANPYSVLAWDTMAEVHSRLGQGEAAGEATRRANRIRRWGAHTLRLAIGIATGVGACLAAVLLIAFVYVAHGWLSHLALCYELKHGYLAQARHEAARLLRASGNPSDIRTLIRALRDSHVRTTAMSALRTLGPGWLPFLRESLKSERCDGARGAIRQIIAAIEEQTGDVMSESEPCLQTSRRAATGSTESPPGLSKQLLDARSRSDRPLKAAAARPGAPAPQTSDEATSPPGRIAELRHKLGLSERKVRPVFDSAHSFSAGPAIDGGTEECTTRAGYGTSHPVGFGSNSMPGDCLYIGMPFGDIVRILGDPTGRNPGTEMLDVAPGSKVVASEATRAQLAATEYCMWTRPEGAYYLVIEDGKLARISGRPK